jgi:hypothetical protein
MFLKVCSNMGIVLPMKVPLRGVPHLSEDDKNSARKVRVRVEHSSAGGKVFAVPGTSIETSRQTSIRSRLFTIRSIVSKMWAAPKVSKQTAVLGDTHNV